MFAAVRPDSFDLPLFLHVAGAAVLVGALVVALVFAASGSPSRLTFRALLWAAVPAFIVMRAAGLWVADKEGYTGDNLPDWLDISQAVTDPAALAIIIATIIAGVSSRKGGMTSKWVTGFTGLAIVLALVAVWAMTAKPT